MSRNLVESALDYANEHKQTITFIPSRRQIDWQGGYVGWTTAEFAAYVRSRSSYVEIQRDHGGPGQGATDDDGFESLAADCKHFDILHIDPWKKYPKYEDALAWTTQMIDFCYERNPKLRFEVGTEQGIRPIEPRELDTFLYDLETCLTPEQFAQIEFVVIQCGTQLSERSNIGSFDELKLVNMLDVARAYDKEAKEHNGDWVSMETVRHKEALGLRHINIAPELGELETRIVLSHIRGAPKFDALYNLCYESGKWKKWVTPSFVPDENREELILICGHYVFDLPEFKPFEPPAEEVRAMFRTKLDALFGRS